MAGSFMSNSRGEARPAPGQNRTFVAALQRALRRRVRTDPVASENQPLPGASS